MEHDTVAAVWAERLGGPLPPEALRLLLALPPDALGVLERALEQARRPVPDPGTRDLLTGLLTRPVLEEVLVHEVAGAERHGAPSLLVVDLDGLTAWMEQQGHLAADLLLVRVADVLTRSSRRSDLLGRLGTDQLGALLPRTDLPRGMVVARRVLARVRAAVRTGSRERAGDLLPRISVALAHLPAPQSPAQLHDAVELALQRARRAGGGVLESTCADDLAVLEDRLRA